MKKKDRVTLHREKLHKEVWQTPVRQLAMKYGMSDVGLAKVCRRMNIPLPPRGYWAKQAYGYEVDKQSLPPVDKKFKAQMATLDKSAEELLHVARNRASGSKIRHMERQRIHRLKAELQDWDTSRRIRMYIAMLHTRHDAPNPDQAEFLAWAERYADHLDPMADFRIAVLDDA